MELLQLLYYYSYPSYSPHLYLPSSEIDLGLGSLFQFHSQIELQFPDETVLLLGCKISNCWSSVSIPALRMNLSLTIWNLHHSFFC